METIKIQNGIILKSIQKFDSHVKLFLIVVSFQAAWLLVISKLGSCTYTDT